MLRIVFGILFILHGLVHFLYFGQGMGYFEMQPGLTWPEGAWAFSWVFGEQAVRLIASICLVAAGIGFLAGGVGLLARQAWWHPVTWVTAAFSSLIFILFWDGKFDRFADKGWVGVLINVLILLSLLVTHWPSFEF